MKLVQVAYGEESEQINQQQALALVQAFPNLKAIIVPAGIGLPAAARALEEAGMIGKVKLTGLAPATLISKYIKDGAAQDIWWNVSDLGYLTYQAAQALAQCKITGKEGDRFTAGRLGDTLIGAGGELILGPAKIVTPENVNEFELQVFDNRPAPSTSGAGHSVPASLQSSKLIADWPMRRSISAWPEAT